MNRTVDQLVTRILTEIDEDIDNGTLPADVRSFTELHDHVDANEYGGLDHVDIGTANEVSDRVDSILRTRKRG